MECWDLENCAYLWKTPGYAPGNTGTFALLYPNIPVMPILDTTIDGTAKLTSLPRLSVSSFIAFTGFSKAQQIYKSA